MKSGELSSRDGGANPLKWTTTEAALAEFLAQRQMNKGAKPRRQPADQGQRSDPRAALANGRRRSAELCSVYHNIWTDYFLAVMLRRRLAHRSAHFRRAVIAGQALLLVLLVGATIGVTGRIAAAFSSPREHQAVERWIARHTDDFLIKKWEPMQPHPDAQGVLVGVHYRYRQDSPRWVHTERWFDVVGEEVREFSFDH